MANHLDRTPQFGKRVLIHATACVTGDVALANDVSVWPMAVIRGDVQAIRIGIKTNVQDNAVLHCTHDSVYSPGGKGLFVGESVTIGHSAVLHGCNIFDRVLIGIGAIVLDGAVINADVMVGAATLVPPHMTLESGYLYIGTPAKKQRPLNKKEIAFLRYSAEHYVRLKNAYLFKRY